MDSAPYSRRRTCRFSRNDHSIPRGRNITVVTGVVFYLHDRGTEGCGTAPPQPSAPQLQPHEAHVGECLVRLPERREQAH